VGDRVGNCTGCCGGRKSNRRRGKVADDVERKEGWPRPVCADREGPKEGKGVADDVSGKLDHLPAGGEGHSVREGIS